MTLRLNGSTSGYVEIDAPAAAGSNTLTLPNGNGSSGQYLQTDGSGGLSWAATASTEYQGPTFRADRGSTSQSFTPSTWTKLQFDSEVFDTDNNYDHTTNYRFTPSKAGYYVCLLQPFFSVTTASATNQEAAIRKNGNDELFGKSIIGGGFYGTQAVSGIIYLNGSTDYIEAYGFSNGGSTVTLVGDISNFSSHFSATWVHD